MGYSVIYSPVDRTSEGALFDCKIYVCAGVDVAFVWVLVGMQINYAVTLLNLPLTAER